MLSKFAEDGLYISKKITNMHTLHNTRSIYLKYDDQVEYTGCTIYPVLYIILNLPFSAASYILRISAGTTWLD